MSVTLTRTTSLERWEGQSNPGRFRSATKHRDQTSLIQYLPMCALKFIFCDGNYIRHYLGATYPSLLRATEQVRHMSVTILCDGTHPSQLLKLICDGHKYLVNSFVTKLVSVTKCSTENESVTKFLE